MPVQTRKHGERTMAGSTVKIKQCVNATFRWLLATFPHRNAICRVGFFELSVKRLGSIAVVRHIVPLTRAESDYLLCCGALLAVCELVVQPYTYHLIVCGNCAAKEHRKEHKTAFTASTSHLGLQVACRESRVDNDLSMPMMRKKVKERRLLSMKMRKETAI